MPYSTDLLDLDTLIAMKISAPKVTQVPFDRAQASVQALVKFSAANEPYEDFDGQRYWKAQLKELLKVKDFPEDVMCLHLGRAYRQMGLSGWREMDGYHIAWSETQLEILKKYFKVEEKSQ